MFEIIDNNGVLYSGRDRDEMLELFSSIIDGTTGDSWDGDLKLVEVIEVTK